MFRTVSVTQGDKLSINQNWLVVTSDSGENRVPIDDLYSVIIDKQYAKFRKYLIEDGYDMIQFSVYSRITRNHDDAKKHLDHLKKNLPPKGSVRVMQITEKQYGAMDNLVGEKTAAEDFLTPKDFLKL